MFLGDTSVQILQEVEVFIMATGHDLKVFHTGLLSRAHSMTSRIGKGQKYKHNVYFKLKDAASFRLGYWCSS